MFRATSLWKCLVPLTRGRPSTWDISSKKASIVPIGHHISSYTRPRPTLKYICPISSFIAIRNYVPRRPAEPAPSVRRLGSQDDGDIGRDIKFERVPEPEIPTESDKPIREVLLFIFIAVYLASASSEIYDLLNAPKDGRNKSREEIEQEKHRRQFENLGKDHPITILYSMQLEQHERTPDRSRAQEMKTVRRPRSVFEDDYGVQDIFSLPENDWEGRHATKQPSAQLREQSPEEQANPFTGLSKWVAQNCRYSAPNIFPAGSSFSDFRPWTAFTAMFTHSSPLHLAACYITSGVFFPGVAAFYGRKRALAIFLVGGPLAAGLHALGSRLANPAGWMTKEELIIKFKDEEVRLKEKVELARYYIPNLGSSGALIALGTITCIICPTLTANLFFIPYAFNIRTLLSLQAAFDLGGLFMDYGLGISHGGHLAGNLAGLLMWRFWVVKMPAKKLLGKSVDDLMNMRKALFKNGGMLKTK